MESKIEIKCKVCGKRKIYDRSVILKGNGLYCSKKCAYVSFRKGREVSCLNCGKLFYLAQSTINSGRKYCSQTCAVKAGRTCKGVIRSKETKEKISKSHHNVAGELNPNWKGGISKEAVKYKNKTWKKYKKWRDSVLLRDNYKCKNCGNSQNLHAHHIIARKTLPDAEFIRANGVTLCDKCHHKTDSWGGGKDKISYNRKGSLLRFVMKVIPHSWHDYPTLGNYFSVKGGTIVIFCSDMKNNSYHNLVFAHEMIESSLVLERKIKISTIDKFDMKYEKERSDGLHGEDDEPGDDPSSPYLKEHQFATKIEKLFAKQLNIDLADFNKTVNNLDTGK